VTIPWGFFPSDSSVQHTAFIGRDHILDVDKSIFSTVNLEHFEGLLDEISEVGGLALAVVDLVSKVLVADLEQVEHGEDLTVIRDESLADRVTARYERLQDLQCDRDDLNVTCVQGDLDWDDQLGDNWQYLSASLLKHVEDTLDCEESVWILLLADSFEKDREVMVVIELLDLYLPVDAVLWAVLNSNRQVTSVVETSEFTCWNVALVECSSNWLLWCRFLLGLE